MGRRKREEGFIPPVRAAGGGFALHFDADDREFLDRLMRELREMLTSTDADPLLNRLFPTAFPDDAEKEAEYQRLMREELVASRVAAIDVASDVLGNDPDDRLDEDQLMAFMQAINAVRIVLGTLLGNDDDEAAAAADEADSPNHHLYNYLGWVLEWTVRALSAGTADTSPDI
jgi:hypothetical protein